jgi:putative transposase
MRRKNLGTVTWHVYARGARRLDLFRDDEDRREYLRLLDLFVRKAGVALWAYALMSNHYHLIVHAASSQLTDLMLRLNHQYAIYHNRKYQLTGHLLDGPYRAHPLRSSLLVLKKIAYVLLNPFKGGLETQVGRYPWTCLPCFRACTGSPLPVRLDSLWRCLGVHPEEGRRNFEGALAREQSKPARLRKDLLTAVESQAQEFEWLMEHAEEKRGDLQGEAPADVAMYWGCLLGIPPRAMARVLPARTAGSIRAALHRIRKRLALDPALESAFPLP